MDFAENDLSHGAGMREPLLAIACGKTKAFGRAVVLVNDGSPPLDHLMFHLDGAWCGSVNCELERREIKL